MACPSTSECFAAGNYLLSGAGRRWAATSAPLPANAQPGSANYQAVACASVTSCTAVGSYAGTQSSPLGLLATSTGSSWTAAEAPLPANAATPQTAQLQAVACPSAGSCSAVGWYFDSSDRTEGLIETWSGSSWTATEEPLPANASHEAGLNVASLNSVACTSSSSCTAVGDYATKSGTVPGLLVSGSGTSWIPAVAPMPPDGDAAPVTLNSITCPSAVACVAAGMYGQSVGNRQGLLLTGSGSAWIASKAPLPANASPAPDVYLNSIDCATPYACAAVGYYADSAGSVQGLLVSGSGAFWAAVEASPPHPAANPGTIMSGVACPTPKWCAAIGDYQNSAGDRQGLLATDSS